MKEEFNKLNPFVKLVSIIALGIVLFFFIKWLAAYIKKNKQQKLLEQSITTGQIVTPTGQAVPVSVDLGTKASAINSAFHDNDWFGASEDEERAMQELMNVPKALIPNLGQIYFALYNENLKSDFQKYLSSSQYSQISYLFA